MKRSIPLILTLGSLLLSGCTFLPTTGEILDGDSMVARDVALYDQMGYAKQEKEEGSASIAAHALGTATFYTPLGQTHNLYCRFDSYWKLLKPQLATDYSITTNVSGKVELVTVAYKRDAVYQAMIDYGERTITYAGSLSSFHRYAKDYSLSTLNLGSQNQQQVVYGRQGETIESFADMTAPIYRRDGRYYMPYGMLESIFVPEIGFCGYYNGNAIFQTESVYDLNKAAADSKGYGKEILDAATENFALNYPSYLDRVDRDALYYALTNRYGLAKERGIASMTSFLNGKDTTSRMLKGNENNAKGRAIFDAFAALDDDHSGVRNLASWAGMTRDGYSRGPNSNARREMDKALQARRDLAYKARGVEVGDVLYHDDVALFAFDSFSFAEKAYEEDGKTLRPDLYKEDTYFLFRKNFAEIAGHSEVKKVVLDVSLNGGGTLGVLFKLLGYVAQGQRDNLTYIRYDDMGIVLQIDSKVDLNGDGEVGDKDIFGRHYDFYILTSECSFSCGNAFPYYARNALGAKTIGRNSGGGECIVGSGYLPMGVDFVFSSKMHLGSFNRLSDEFTGDEGGAGVDIALDVEKFYDLSAIAHLLAESK